MKASNILSLVATVLASKVAAECFSEKLGFPCCVETKEVVNVDENGQWGIENNNWCGIETVSVEQVSNEVEDVQFSDEEEQVEFTNEQDVQAQDESSEEETGSIEASPVSSDYMSKLQILNSCPMEARTKQDGVKYPTSEKITYHSNTTGTDRQMNIILPVDYDGTKKYPVVYYLHGIFGNEDSMLDETAIALPVNLYNEGKAKEAIFVLPNTYAPPPGKEVVPDFNQDYFDGYDNFINELIDDIMPYVEQNYSVLTGKENTGLCGFSMGGRNSLYIGYKRPDLFGYVGAFSPAPGVTPGDDFSGHHPGLFQESEFRTDVPPFVTLVSCGTNDSVVGTFPKSYHEILTTNGQEHIWFEVPGADHDDKAIAAGLYNYLSTAFGVLDK